MSRPVSVLYLYTGSTSAVLTPAQSSGGRHWLVPRPPSSSSSCCTPSCPRLNPTRPLVLWVRAAVNHLCTVFPVIWLTLIRFCLSAPVVSTGRPESRLVDSSCGADSSANTTWRLCRYFRGNFMSSTGMVRVHWLTYAEWVVREPPLLSTVCICYQQLTVPSCSVDSCASTYQVCRTVTVTVNVWFREDSKRNWLDQDHQRALSGCWNTADGSSSTLQSHGGRDRDILSDCVAAAVNIICVLGLSWQSSGTVSPGDIKDFASESCVSVNVSHGRHIFSERGTLGEEIQTFTFTVSKR